MLHHPPGDLARTSPAVVDGPSFPASFRLAATAVVLALAGAALRQAGEPAGQAPPPATSALAAVLAAVVVGGWLSMLRSRTSIDGVCIRQRGLWTREVHLAEITQLRLIHVPGLTWLVAPRLVVRTGGIASRTFHSADAQVIAAFRRLAYGAR